MEPTINVDDKDDGLENVRSALLDIQQAVIRQEEDPEQNTLAETVQKYRSMLLNFATLAYLEKPRDAKMLEAVSSLVAQIEKSVRDDRKEKAKKQENDDNRLSFNQMLEAMQNISSGTIKLPTFEVDSFFLDPSRSLLELSEDIKPIKPEELTFGNGLVDLDGNAI